MVLRLRSWLKPSKSLLGSIFTKLNPIQKPYFPRKISFSDLVLRKVKVIGKHVIKLALNWEGLFRIRQIIYPRTYRLVDLNGISISCYWNSKQWQGLLLKSNSIHKALFQGLYTFSSLQGHRFHFLKNFLTLKRIKSNKTLTSQMGFSTFQSQVNF